MLEIFDKLIGPVTTILDKVIPDKDLRTSLAHEIATMAAKQSHENALAQIEVNKQEAAHKSLFVAGWRPFIGWTCGIALAWHFIFSPVTMFFCSYLGIALPPLPEFDMTSLLTVLGGILGLGGFRTFEKVKGVQRPV